MSVRLLRLCIWVEVEKQSLKIQVMLGLLSDVLDTTLIVDSTHSLLSHQLLNSVVSSRILFLTWLISSAVSSKEKIPKEVTVQHLPHVSVLCNYILTTI